MLLGVVTRPSHGSHRFRGSRVQIPSSRLSKLSPAPTSAVGLFFILVWRGREPSGDSRPRVDAIQRGLKTTVWIECGSELISTDEEPTTREYGPPRGVGFMTTTASVPSSLTNAVVSSMLRLGDARIRLAPGRMNFEKWPM